MEIQMCHGQITLSKLDEICLSEIPNQVSIISMHTPSLVEIHWYLLKLSSWNENTDLSRADNFVKNWRNLPINNPKPDLHNINADTQFGGNLQMFTHVIVRKWKYGHCGQITLSKTDEICPLTIQNRSPQYQCTHPGWWKSIDVYLSYCRERKIQTYRRQITLSNKNYNTPPLSCRGPTTIVWRGTKMTKFAH